MPSTQPRPSAEPLQVERVPWSLLGPDFVASWGRFDPRDPQPEHMELIGQNGSGKTFLLGQINAEMVRRRQTSIIYVATKRADKVISSFGWPIVDTWREAQRYDQVLYWPRTTKTGRARKLYQADRIQELLDNLWDEDANTTIEFDEFAYVEALDADIRATLQMYLREGRSHNITVVAGKQRIQGVQRDMHSETRISVGFKLKDEEDNMRLAEAFGNRKEFFPVINSLSKEDHEFLIKRDLGDSLYISWVDKPIDIAKIAEKTRGYTR